MNALFLVMIVYVVHKTASWIFSLIGINPLSCYDGFWGWLEKGDAIMCGINIIFLSCYLGLVVSVSLLFYSIF